MPAFLTHCIFAEDVLELIEDQVIKEKIKDRMALYYLGAQGPDIFFYYKAKPWIKYDGIEKLGHLMHDNKTAEFFIKSLDYIKRIRDAEYNDKNCTYFDLLVYIVGYFCHFALDQSAHPLIHYRAGIDTKKNKETRKYHNYHKLLESTIDAYMLNFKKSIQANKYKSYKLIEDCKYQTVCLGNFYSDVIKEVYDIKISKQQTATAVTDIIEILKILYDPLGIKKVFFRCLEFLMNKKGEITSAMYPQRIKSKIDYLNLNHEIYLHPCSKDIKSSKSFIDIYGEALLLAVKYTNAAISYILDKESLPSLKSILLDVSYSTGLKCGTDEDLFYFDSIFERK